MALAYYRSPLGIIAIIGNHSQLNTICFIDQFYDQPSTEIPAEVQRCYDQLAQYFNGQLQEFNLNIKPEGTSFQKKVWQSLLKIKYGRTLSYLQLARELGDKNAVRAVGKANGENKLAIIIPCHRVVGANGELTGYAGGVKKKEWLLNHEKAIMPNCQLKLF
jgi:methylated-DNA-[protein]-cysteine S-methyltransferase